MSYNTVGIIKNGVKQKLPVVMVAPKVDGPDYVEVVADGVKTWSQLIDELYSLADTSKVAKNSALKANWSANDYALYRFAGKSSDVYQFTFAITEATNTQVNSFLFAESGSKLITSNNGTRSDISSTVATSGYKLTLYYDTATLDLTTRASNCVYDNSNSGISATEVQGAIDEVVAKVDRGSVSVTADGVETYAALIGRLYASCEYGKVNTNSSIDYDSSGDVSHFTVSKYSTTRSYFSHIDIESKVQTTNIKLASSATFTTATTSGTTDNSTVVPLAGLKLTLNY